MKIEIPSKDVLRALCSVSLASSTDDTRPFLNGVLVRTCGNKYNMVATNGHIIALWCADGQKDLEDAEFHMTTDGVEQLIVELKSIERRFTHENGKVCFDLDAKTYTHRLGTMNMELVTGDQEFPDYERVVKSACKEQDCRASFVGVGTEVFGTAFEAFSTAGKCSHVKIEFGKDSVSPVVIKSDSVPELTVIAMPLRVDCVSKRQETLGKPDNMLSRHPG